VFVDQPDDLPVDLPGQHHADNVHGFRRGDPEARAERRSHPQPVKVRVDLRSAAVHHNWPQPGVPQEHHVLRERPPQPLLGHRVTAVLQHDSLAMEPLEPRKSFDESGRLPGSLVSLLKVFHVEYAEFSCTYATDRSVVLMAAAWRPAARSTVIVTSRGRRSTAERSSPGAPDLHTQTPLMATPS